MGSINNAIFILVCTAVLKTVMLAGRLLSYNYAYNVVVS